MIKHHEALKFIQTAFEVDVVSLSVAVHQSIKHHFVLPPGGALTIACY